MWTLVWLIVAVSGALALQNCENTPRGEVKFYFDTLAHTCFALPVDCTSSVQVSNKLYKTEEECTMENMVRRWKSFQLSCGGYQRLAVYRRSNGDMVPYIFASSLCHSRSKSEICNKDESCYTHSGFGYCCHNRAFEGEGPSSGLFNFTGMGGKNNFMVRKTVTVAPAPIPFDCNVNGDRGEVEWYVENAMACVSRRKYCSTPGFDRNVSAITYRTQQECMDANRPNLKMTYRLTCASGYSPVKQGNYLVFNKNQCGSMHHSDMCNRDEFCAFKNSSPFAFCCGKSTGSSIVSYDIYGKNYRRRSRRNTQQFYISI